MVRFTAQLQKFGSKGEKTGWTYFEIPAAIADRIKQGTKKSFRVKGMLDDVEIKGVATVPVGEGNFIIAVNATMRKKLKKVEGASIKVKLEEDTAEIPINAELMECLRDEPAAFDKFSKLPGSHQKYYSRWIESAKTESTKAKRIAQTVDAMVKGLTYGEMLRAGDTTF
jgi:hypothetical protein